MTIYAWISPIDFKLGRYSHDAACAARPMAVTSPILKWMSLGMPAPRIEWLYAPGFCHEGLLAVGRAASD
jgi:hypothetical protein